VSVTTIWQLIEMRNTPGPSGYRKLASLQRIVGKVCFVFQRGYMEKLHLCFRNLLLLLCSNSSTWKLQAYNSSFCMTDFPCCLWKNLKKCGERDPVVRLIFWLWLCLQIWLIAEMLQSCHYSSCNSLCRLPSTQTRSPFCCFSPCQLCCVLGNLLAHHLYSLIIKGSILLFYRYSSVEEQY